MSRLNSPIDLHGMSLSNRIAMAPLTRCRAGQGDVPQPISALYYSQRASAGLIITEATNVTPKSCAFEKAPGIYSDQQVAGWKVITDSVHKAGGHLFMQLWHCGRVGSEAILNGQSPLSPSGINDDLESAYSFNVFPNPATDAANINFDLPKNQNVKIDLYDVTGRLIKNIIDQNLTAGEHQLSITNNDLNGIYLLRCYFDNQQYTNQISFIK